MKVWHIQVAHIPIQAILGGQRCEGTRECPLMTLCTNITPATRTPNGPIFIPNALPRPTQPQSNGEEENPRALIKGPLEKAMCGELGENWTINKKNASLQQVPLRFQNEGSGPELMDCKCFPSQTTTHHPSLHSRIAGIRAPLWLPLVFGGQCWKSWGLSPVWTRMDGALQRGGAVFIPIAPPIKRGPGDTLLK